METHRIQFLYRMIICGAMALCCTCAAADHESPFGLRLPKRPVPDRWSRTRPIEPGQAVTYATLDGPGCIRHLWATVNTQKVPQAERQVIVRIYFDGAKVPHVEAPLGDFFGVMHGVGWYPINTPLLSVKERSGYNCYFPMPFARSARIEFESAVRTPLYLQVDWHRYPDQKLDEPRRFCARWRREMPTRRYSDDFFMLDADGPGQLVGFVYGVRLIDQADRWSHGGAENIYLDGQADHPAFIRGIGGEDTFGASYGGALHKAETHLDAGLPFYTHEDVGEARPAQRLVGYRFYTKDRVPFEQSIHMRFGCMANDICATVYWYQEGVPRPYVKMPDWKQLLPGAELAAGRMDLPLDNRASWTLRGPLANANDQAITRALQGREPDAATSASSEDRTYNARHGFVDFGHVFRPHQKGVGVFHDQAAAQARGVLHVSDDTAAELRLSWDDRLVLQVNDERPVDLGRRETFRASSVPVNLRQGDNRICITLSNTQGSNHGGWVFAFRAKAADGTLLFPHAP